MAQIKMSAQIESLQENIRQNNDLYEGKKALENNMDFYYDGLELDSEEQKTARWKRTPKYIYYPKIVSSFTSSIFKKPPHTELPKTLEVNNVDLLGNSLNEYVSQLPEQVLKQGFCTTIVDYSDSLDRPYLKMIKPEDTVIIRTRNTKGYPEISMFAYQVVEDRVDDIDEFETKNVVVHYVYDIYEEKARVRKYERMQKEEESTEYQKKGKSKKVYQDDELISTSYMMMDNKDLDYLPVFLHCKNSNNFTVEKSVLQDVSDLNIDLINRVVDQVEVLHLCAIPTPYITGMDPDDSGVPSTIGSSKLWILGDPDAKVGLLEFSGKSAESHSNYVAELKEVMAVQGAQILKKQGVSRETATSVLIRSGQETAVISTIVNNISSQIESFLAVYAQWYSEKSEDIKFTLNTDFLNVDMEPNAQIALVKSWLDGAISHETVFAKMKEGEIIPSDRTFDEELKLIAKNKPPFHQKEKETELKIDAEEKMQEFKEKEKEPLGDGSGSNQEEGLEGSNMEIDNGTRNPVKK